MPDPLWSPTPEHAADTEMARFRRAAEVHTGQSFADYWALHRWSVREPADFWHFYSEYAQLPLKESPHTVMSGDSTPHIRWFEGATLNYAEAVLFPAGLADAEQTAIVAVTETGQEQRLSYAELRREVARCAAALRAAGIEKGDRVAAYSCNVPESVVLMLACASFGAIFSSCSPDFGLEAARARFEQIEPRMLVAADGYVYGGKRFETLETVTKLAEALSLSAEQVVLLGYPGESAKRDRYLYWQDWLAAEAALELTPLPFDHPLYILFSSGTTGLPKAITHRAGGALIMHHKEHKLHSDIKAGDVAFYFTTCGWMMWNWLVSALAQAATIVLYEGSPGHPSLEVSWRLAERLGVTHFGTSARFIHSCKTAGLEPQRFVTLPALRCILSTGSPLSPSGFEWVYDAVKRDVQLAGISGGTDIVGCFMLGVPTLPVYAGQIQAPGLGVDLDVFDDEGHSVRGAPGELVCKKPLPSMPLKFWNDPDLTRYQEAYFSHYPGVWRHGDLVAMTPEGGIIVYGRSDATLNPGGVRIGTAEIYRPLEQVPEVLEALAVGKRAGEDEVIWLFVVLQPRNTLDAELETRIKQQIRQAASPRHVPRRIFAVSQLPRTRSGKSMEIAVSRLVNGQNVPNRQVMVNPEALDEIAELIREAA